MTLAFTIYPLELSDTGNWYAFGSEGGNIIVGHWDSGGGIWLGARGTSGASKSMSTPGGAWGLSNWYACVIAYRVFGGVRYV